MNEFQFLLRQTKDRPLYPDMLFSKPENIASRGKLTIVGGNIQSFASISKTLNSATDAGAGRTSILLPDILRKYLKTIREAVFLPSTPSGSLAVEALGEIIGYSNGSDCLALAGDFGKNSETSILLEKILLKYQGVLVIAGDSLESLITSINIVKSRKNTVLILSFNELQKLATTVKPVIAFKHNFGMIEMAKKLHDLSLNFIPTIMTYKDNSIFVAEHGKVSQTKTDLTESDILSNYPGKVCTWVAQNPHKIFEALTTSLVD